MSVCLTTTRLKMMLPHLQEPITSSLISIMRLMELNTMEDQVLLQYSTDYTKELDGNLRTATGPLLVINLPLLTCSIILNSMNFHPPQCTTLPMAYPTRQNRSPPD